MTGISARGGGVFPRTQGIAIIDGRNPVPEHGSSKMPVWGDALRRTERNDEAIIHRRIEALVMHLQPIQVNIERVPATRGSATLHDRNQEPDITADSDDAHIRSWS